MVGVATAEMPEISIATSQIQFATERVFALTEYLVTLNPKDLN
jgi:hypothetical protein